MRLLCCALVLAASIRVQTEQASVVLRGAISGTDNHTYREVPFRVPAGTSRITIDFSYSGGDEHTTIDLGVLDPERFRGWGGGKPGPITLSETDATPSYLPGPIPSGAWKLLLGIPNIRPGAHSEFTARIYFQSKGEAPAVSTFSSAPLRTEAGWYRGDLHLHTAHSDGSCLSQTARAVPCPVFKVLEAAAARDLDFVALTDHNTISQSNDVRELQPYFDQLLMIAGREITTFEGHANVFGTTEFIDFRLGSRFVPTIGTLLDEFERLHALVSINHPNLPSGESCMGCGWTAPDTDFSRIQAIEAVNGNNSEGPFSGISFWEAQLNRGFHLTGIGGSDTHRPDEKSGPLSGVGHPETVVYAENLSEHAILDGIRKGQVFIDIAGGHKVWLEFTAESHGDKVSMGGTLPAQAWEAIRFSVHVKSVGGGHIETIEDGKAIPVAAHEKPLGDDQRQAFDLANDGGHHWVRINVRDGENHLVIVGNPIYW